MRLVLNPLSDYSQEPLMKQKELWNHIQIFYGEYEIQQGISYTWSNEKSDCSYRKSWPQTIKENENTN